MVSVGVKTGSSTDNWMYGVANCIIYGQVDYEVVETAVGSTKMLRINALMVVRTVIYTAHGRTS